MLKETDFIQEWINEGEERGEARGEVRGETRASQDMLLRLLRSRFGSLTPDTEARVAELTHTQCQEVFDRALAANDLAELGF